MLLPGLPGVPRDAGGARREPIGAKPSAKGSAVRVGASALEQGGQETYAKVVCAAGDGELDPREVDVELRDAAGDESPVDARS